MDFLFLWICIWRKRNDSHVQSSRCVHGVLDRGSLGVYWLVQCRHDPDLERWLRPAPGQLRARSVPGIPGWCSELGQRTIYRQSAMPVPVSGTMYTVYSGLPDGGRVRCPSTNIARNRWNFDYHIYYSGGVQNSTICS